MTRVFWGSFKYEMITTLEFAFAHLGENKKDCYYSVEATIDVF